MMSEDSLDAGGGIDRFMAEMGLDYEMHNSMLQAASTHVKGDVFQFTLENFTASGEIWTDAIDPIEPSLLGLSDTQPAINIPHSPYDVGSPFSLPSPGTQVPRTQSAAAALIGSFLRRNSSSNSLSGLNAQASAEQTLSRSNSANNLLLRLSPPPNGVNVPSPLPVVEDELMDLEIPATIPSNNNQHLGPRPTLQLNGNYVPADMKRKLESAAGSGMGAINMPTAHMTPAVTGNAFIYGPSSQPVRSYQPQAEKRRRHDDDELSPINREEVISYDDSVSPGEGDDLVDDEEKRRFAHIHAEQKRRNNIKNAFIDLKEKVPQYKDKTNVSKAMILKGATDYITLLSEYRDEVFLLRKEIEELKQSQNNNLSNGALKGKRTTKVTPKKELDGALAKRLPNDHKSYFD